MPGMGRSLQTGNSLIVSSFHTALFHQFIAIFVLGALCAIGFNVFRTVQYRRLKAHGVASFPSAPSEPMPEPAARRILRIGFGALWIFDGLLQMQSSMPLGLPSGVIQPSASGSPGWVQHLVNTGVTIWSNHPIQAASATVWIQLGIGLWLLVAPRGRWSRFGGLASVGWGLLVWSFGEAFGGLFSPGVTWLFGAPGAVLFYCAAGILIALPERAYATARLGRIVLALGGLFLIGMAVLQAWPGRGFWQGHGGTLTGMVRSMAQTPQPGFLSSWVSSFGSLVAAHGWAVNLFAVVALATIGGLLLSGRPRLSLVGLIALVPLCLADWVLVEDLGFLGGLGTDPNSMLPMALIFVAGYVAMVRVPVAATRPEPAVEVAPAAVEESQQRLDRRPWWERASLSYAIRTAAAVAALAIVLVGAAPMATAAVNGSADPILSEALNGSPNTSAATGAALHPDRPAWPDRQSGQPPRPCGGVDLPRSGLHLGLPTDRPGVPPDGPAVGRRRAQRGLRRNRGQPDLPVHLLHQGIRQPGIDEPPAELVLPHGFGHPAPTGLELLRGPRQHGRCRGDGRPQRSRVHHRRPWP